MKICGVTPVRIQNPVPVTRTIVSHMRKLSFGPGNISSLAYIIWLHFHHLYLFFKGVCVSVRKAGVLKETPEMNPEGLSKLNAISLTHIHESALRFISVLRHCWRILGRSFFLCVEAAPHCKGWECGVSSVEHRLWEAEWEYKAQMDVKATSVAPPGWVLSAEMLPHTLDGRRRREKGILCGV